jgi:hypothetical protein
MRDTRTYCNNPARPSARRGTARPLPAPPGGMHPLFRSIALVTVASLGIATAYLAKSAAGIDLLPGPSPLHDLLYPLLRRG